MSGTHDSAREVIARALSHRRPSAPEKAADILSALQSAGYAVVPVEPTEAMIEAGARARSYDYSQDYFDDEEREEIRDFVKAEYRAMLLAAEEKNDARK